MPTNMQKRILINLFNLIGEPGEQPVPLAHAAAARHQRADGQPQALRCDPGDGRRQEGQAQDHLDEGVPQGVQDRLRAEVTAAALVQVN